MRTEPGVIRPRSTLQFGHGTEAVEISGRLVVVPLTWSMLQFGHGTEAVEICPGDSPPRASHFMLQFGHGTEAVEIRARGLLARLWKSRFNSATALKPWRS